VRRIDLFLEWLDNVALEVNRSAAFLERLDQSILAKAFIGELLGQQEAESAQLALVAE
jgi:hypothetical protein